MHATAAHPTLLLAYDGSPDAQAAIDHVALLAPGAQVTVISIWEPYVDMLCRTGAFGLGMGASGSFADAQRMDEASRTAARERADEGAARGVAAGVAATGRDERREGDVAHTILAAADDVEADLIVLGTRGLGGIKTFLLGSVSHEVMQHSGRPVLVVPSPALAARRRDHADAHAVPA